MSFKRFSIRRRLGVGGSVAALSAACAFGVPMIASAAKPAATGTVVSSTSLPAPVALSRTGGAVVVGSADGSSTLVATVGAPSGVITLSASAATPVTPVTPTAAAPVTAVAP